uniref:Zgc:152774 n=1 Tax=Neogobius melanostomus TaxID=47308 RepID=A0A8C6U950_9GOBI
MCPAFLNSNSTSHTWPFSAIAELIDNAADPGVFAKQIWINIHEEADQLCMTFTDNGSGMTPNKLHKMLSFGFTDKGIGRTGVPAIGVYGNGFKSGSMRLGRDALIFTKNGGCQSVGMLSQTYLENIKAQSVIVPIVPFNQQTNILFTADSEASLAAILQHSIISSQEQIQAHFDSISSKKGTKILIWNLRRAKDGNPEIDFETDPADFRLPEIQIQELKKNLKNSGLRAEQIIPDIHYSLKAYLSILYLRPRIHVILRGKRIPSKLVSQQLTHIEYDVYKPHFNKDKVKVMFGINEKNKEYYGIMMYHKNRLIKAYEKVGCQLKSSGPRAGVGVIGIIECDFLKPAHNKQDFEYTKEYRVTIGALGIKLNDYWKEVMERKARQKEFEAVTNDKSDTGPMWLQCGECLKWRSVPDGHYRVCPENWSCSQNPNPRYRSCSSPEETDDNEDLLTASYLKSHKRSSRFDVKTSLEETSVFKRWVFLS